MRETTREKDYIEEQLGLRLPHIWGLKLYRITGVIGILLAQKALDSKEFDASTPD